jgi:cytochrome c oxidase subunit I
MNDAAVALTGGGEPREREAGGLYSWIASLDHKQLGIVYLITGIVFFIAGGVEALVIRTQLASARNTFVSPDTFNQMFTMHGTTMIFLVVIPLVIGLGIYLVPLQIGARDMAYPRLNALGAWLLVLGGLLLYYSFVAGGAPNAGWFSYAPLSEKPYSMGTGVDYWILGLFVLGISTIGSAINFIVTIIKLRAPGMTMTRLPLFTWMTFVNSFLILAALPVLNASLAMLLIDRLLGGHFFTPQSGGSAVLWQHFFWSFGHPEVYIMVLPAFGVISEVIPVFARKPIFGYEFIAGSTAAIAFLSLAVWAHHMFAVGLGRAADIVFAVASMLIAIPTGVKVLNWCATLWGGAIRFTTPMLFAMAFLVQFTLGGITGVSFSAVPIDWQVEDSYYLVAHLHYVAVGGIVFAVFAGFYYWFPKMTGRMLSETLGKWNFWLMAVGFNLTFFIQHVLGLLGMPRRVWTYPNLPHWGTYNMISTVGAYLLGAGMLVFIYNVSASLRRGRAAGDNPWNAWTLEWATSSPPPEENFRLVPPVRGRRPLWDLAHPRPADHAPAPARARGRVAAEIGGPELGMLTFIASEAVFFVILIIAYGYYHEAARTGALAARALDPIRAGVNTLFLLASSATMWLAGKSLARGNPPASLGWVAATILLGAVFLFGQVREWTGLIRQNVTISHDLFGTTFFTLTGFHGLHVALGLLLLLMLFGLGLRGQFKARRSTGLEVVGIYWHFVDAVWIVVYSVIYLWSVLLR